MLKNNVRARLIAGALLPLVVAALMQAAYSVASQRQLAVGGLEAKGSALTKLLVDVVGPSLALDDGDSVTEGLSYVANDTDFHFAMVLDKDGKPVAYRGPEAERARVTAAIGHPGAAAVTRSGGDLIATAPIVSKDQRLGTVVVGLRTAVVEQAAAHVTTLAALFSLGGIIISVLVVVVLASRIERRNREMSTLLESVEQGFLTASVNGSLAAERSAVATMIVGPHKPDQHLWDALEPIDPDVAAWLRIAWDDLRQGFLPIEVVLGQLPRQITFDDRTYRIEYKPLMAGETLRDVLIVLTDNTVELARARAEAAERDLLRMIDHVTRDRAGFHEFFEEARMLVERITAVPVLDLAQLQRDLHTLKGNCGIYGILQVAEICHDAEDRLADAGLEAAAVTIASLDEVWRAVSARLERFVGGGGGGPTVDPDDLAVLLAAIGRGASAEELQRVVSTWHLEKLDLRFRRFSDQLRGLATRFGKGDLEIDIDTAGVRLAPTTWKPLWTAFSHLLRNAIDHGLEDPIERKEAGKLERGHVALRARSDGSTLQIVVEDDGRGVDWSAVRAKAEAAGLPAATHADLVAALFSSGVTTRDEVSELSGRGVGLAAVREACQQLHGTIDVESERGRGTRFTFRFEHAGHEIAVQAAHRASRTIAPQLKTA